MQAKTKLKIQKFIVDDLWQLLFVAVTISFFAWLLNKPIQSVMFCATHLIVRPQFNKQFHCGTTAMCLFVTLTIAFLGISTTLPLSVSLISAIPVATGVCYVGYLAQDRIDCLKALEKYRGRSIWKMSRQELADYCWACGIRNDKLEFVLMVVIDEMSFTEIAKKLFVSVDTLKHTFSPFCKQKLNITSWKPT